MTHPLRRRPLSIFVLLLSLPIGLAPVAQAEPVRIALPQIQDSRGVPPGDNVTPLVALYLRERLAECSGVRVVDDARANAIIAQSASGVREVAPGQLVAVFSEYMPIDALVQYAFRDGVLRLTINKAGGSDTIEYGKLGAGDRQATVHALAADLAAALGLPPGDRTILTEKRITGDDAFHAYYYSQLITLAYPRNSAEPRLKLLRKVFSDHPADARLAARIVEDANWLLRATNRMQDYAKTGLAVATFVMPVVLGTPWESSAYGIIKLRPAAFEGDLLDIARPVVTDAVDALIDDALDIDLDDPRETLEVDMKMGSGEVDRVGNAIFTQRLGAIRALGVMQSKPGFEIILKAATQAKASVRMAAAEALEHTKGGLDELKALAADDDVNVAFAAGYSLWKRGETPAGFAARAVRMLQSTNGLAHRVRAAEALGALATADHVAVLRTADEGSHPTIRRHARAALLRLGAVDDATLFAWLDSTDHLTITATLPHLPDRLDDAQTEKVKQLGNDPLTAVAQAARIQLVRYRPEDPRARDRFDLDTEHPYVRMKIVDRIAASDAATALDDLEAACSSRGAHTRAHALKALVGKSPERAKPLLLKALRDPYPWVRLHAAALVPAHVAAGDADALRAAAASERDPAIVLYLEDALALAEGRPLPEPPPAARSVAERTGLAWLTGLDSDAENSPFGAYYILHANVSDAWKKAYESGKIFFGRTTPVGNPGQILTDPAWRDRFWLALNSSMSTNELRYIDGLVYGEETMNIKPGTLWKSGWRLFCLDAGIDPATVSGDREKLTPTQSAAFSHWALERCVDGFNMLYDYTKLRLGKLRPGIQVCTFLPGEGGGLTPADHRWKFDVGGLYDYKGCNRIAAYTLTRRMKTTWPERPALWLSLGIGGYEMNPVKYTLKTPTRPMTNRGRRCYADSTSAWLAGADVGWFSTWIFVEPLWKGTMATLSGVQIKVGDIFGDTALLKRGIDYSFRGILELYEGGGKRKPDIAEMDVVDRGELDDWVLDPDAERKVHTDRIAAEQKRMYDGFQFYGKYVYDCGRMFSDLPRLNYRSPVLAVRPGISVWTRGSNFPDAPGFALLTNFDFLCEINQVVHRDLSIYRMIAVRDVNRFSDATIADLATWLKETPGLLYVHRSLPSANSAETATADDHDGMLELDWPWESAVAATPREKAKARGKGLALTVSDAGAKLSGAAAGPLEFKAGKAVTSFALSSPSAQALVAETNGQPVLVLWRDPAFKGAVIFDGMAAASGEYLDLLRASINGLYREGGIGQELTGPAVYQALDIAGVKAAATSPYYRGVRKPRAFKGVDLVTGETNPGIGTSRGAVITSDDFTGQYIAAHDGVSVLSDKPFAEVVQVPGGLRVKSTGLVRAAGNSGRVSLETDGNPLAPVDDVQPWLLYGTAEGAAPMTNGADAAGGVMVFLRTPQTVTISDGP